MSEETVELIIRQAEQEDAAMMITFLKQVASQTTNLVFDETDICMSIAEEKEHIQRVHTSANSISLVALVGDKIVGMADVTANSQTRLNHVAEYGVSVLQDYWGLGIGSMLTEEALTFFEYSPLHRLTLDVRVDNVRAVSLYQKYGFEKEGVIRDGLRVNDNYIDLIRMAIVKED